MVMTGGPKQEERVPWSLGTWANRTASRMPSEWKVHFMSESTSEGLPLMVLSDVTDGSYGNNFERFFLGLQWISQTYPNVDWVVKLDDDTALHPLNLKTVLEQCDPTDSAVYGRCEDILERGRLSHVDGGAGNIFTGQLLRIMARKNMLYPENVRRLMYGGKRVSNDIALAHLIKILETHYSLEAGSMTRCNSYIFQHNRVYIKECVTQWGCITVHHANESVMSALMRYGRPLLSFVSFSPAHQWGQLRNLYDIFERDS